MVAEIEHIGRFYAEEIRAAAALPEGPSTERLLSAFATVSREQHAGPGPWLLGSPLRGVKPKRRTPDSDPKHLYHNVLVALDEDRGINIGQPSLWAQYFLTARVAEGHHILQIGAGSGYFTAILAELVGPSGSVTALEIEPMLHKMAASALEGRSNVSVSQRSAATDLSADEGQFDLIIAFAGTTHPLPGWWDLLKPNGRMLLPVTGENGWGAMVVFNQAGDSYQGQTVGRCGFYPCSGARHPGTEAELGKLWSNTALLSGARLKLSIVGDQAYYEVIETQPAK
ncbi:MAG: methyltransferase domain-containing protein [Pseudomonadota bacterium]